MTRVLVCGGRHYDWAKALEWLDRYAFERISRYVQHINLHSSDMVIIHGSNEFVGPKGADLGAAKWAELRGFKTEVYEAKWKTHGLAAGPVRNAKMLKEGQPDVVIAFPGHKGTDHMVGLAIVAGIPVIRGVA